MILTTNRQTEVLYEGVLTSKKMQIDESDKAVLMMILSQGLYSDSIGSLIREYCTNALDSHIEAGNKEPIIVSLKDENPGEWTFSVQDFGVGLSPERVENIFSKYAASTKRDSNEQYGAFGLGSKSGLSYRDNFYIISRYNTTEYTYMMHKGEEGTELTLINEEFTSEVNGVTIKIPLKNSNDIYEFIDKVKYQLCYFEDVYLNIPNISNDFKIIKNTDWKYSSLYPGEEMHLCLDNVYYPIDWKALKIKPIEFPVGLNFSVSDGITPTPNRESILITPTTKQMILDKIGAVCSWFIQEYNKKMQFTSFKDVIGYERHFEEFEILKDFWLEFCPEMYKYSNVPISNPTLSYAPDLNIRGLVNKSGEILSNYKIIKKWTSSGWKKPTKKSWGATSVPEYLPINSKAVVVNPNEPISNINMDYIKETIPNVYIVHNIQRVVSQPTYQDRNLSYQYFIPTMDVVKNPDLSNIQMSQFNSICEELTKDLVLYYKDITPDEAWLQKRKESRLKNKRIKKEKEQIFPKFSRVGELDRSKIIFDQKELIELTNVEPSLRVVYATENKKETLEEVTKILNSVDSEIKTAIITISDLKKLSNTDLNWIEVEDFMKNKNKTLGKFITAYRIETLMENNPLLFGDGKKLSPMLERKIEKLENYKYKQLSNSRKRRYDASEEFMELITEAAIQGNWWDKTIVSNIEELEKELPILNFLSVFGRERDLECHTNQKKKVLNVMREVYLYRKLKSKGKIKI